VLGASRRRESIGGLLFRNIIAGEFEGVEALRAGTRAICVISPGFAEIGEEGRERQDQLLARVRAHGGRLVGPNCLGVAVSALRLNATFGPRALPPGPVAFSQLPESRVSRPRTRAGCGPSRVAAASRRPVASAHLS
jgi:hypothetical protein